VGKQVYRVAGWLIVTGRNYKPPCLRPKVEDWNWETIFTDILGLSSTTVTYNWSAKQSSSVKKTQNKGYYAVQGHRGRCQLKCDGVIAAYCSNLGYFAFL